ncbi:MAG: hypothetical protein JW818_06000 [Pirellulales bacterium]|nr:hypothetical protein [Pirellulales bacterium]
MKKSPRRRPSNDQDLKDILGYLNFSSGAEDVNFLGAVNRLFGSGWSVRARSAGGAKPAWRAFHEKLVDGAKQLRGDSQAFAQLDQAEAVIGLVFERFLPAYREHHRDLLFHQTDESLYRALFFGRVFEAVLAEGKPWDEPERIVPGALHRLNDFVGHRPVAALEGRQTMRPFDHEAVRPVPLWIRGVGAESGAYGQLIDKALETLQETTPELLRQAYFDFDLLEELAFDPRAYDFDHPAHRRPNYQFGQWDPHRIDNRGFYRRFVIPQLTLDAVLDRIEHRGRLAKREVLEEAATVLAGIILMGSGISGQGPETHDSTVTLASLLPRIAGYRDRFYEEQIGRLTGRHAQRLRTEAQRLHQPFAGARQHLNQFLGLQRASQLQHVHIALLFARMGYPDSAARHAAVVPAASARMLCEIECRLTAAHRHLDGNQLDGAASAIAQIEDLLHRAIECGAMIDPRNILGLDCHYPLFNAIEDSCHDSRADELIELMEDLFALYARLETEAAATGDDALKQRLSDSLRALAQWWDQFATTEVSAVEGISGQEAWESAEHVAGSLGAWRKAGTAAGDVAFWRQHVGTFTSPKAYAVVVEALLSQQDLVAAMALLMQWLSEADSIPLVQGHYSFHRLAMQWLDRLWQPAGDVSTARAVHPEDRWTMTRKFMDYLEAGGETYWEVPRLELAGATDNVASETPVEPETADDDLFEAAYESVVYRDTTDDGFEGEVFESGDPTTDFELTSEAERISKRLAFLRMLARLWRRAAAALAAADGSQEDRDVLAAWLAQARSIRSGLLALLDSVHRYPISPPSVSDRSMVEFDQCQAIKEMLLERISAVIVETSDAARWIAARVDDTSEDGRQKWEMLVGRVFRALHQGNKKAVGADWSKMLSALKSQPLIYLPLVRGGHPRRMTESRVLQNALGDLLVGLPRLGLLVETGQLLETILQMERRHPIGSGGVTEFDRMFEFGFKAIMRCLVAAAGPGDTEDLIESIQTVADPLVRLWISHSRGIRFSPLEMVDDEDEWEGLQWFIAEYGGDLFTQPFMTYGNLRAIMHQGPEVFLEWLAEKPDAEEAFRLVADLDGRLPRDRAAAWLGVIIETVLDNYNEYMDYNSSTTQSDHGEMLYTLLDFLRLTGSYDRAAWHLRPMVWAHEVLTREGHSEAAALWQEEFVANTSELAEEHLREMRHLERTHGMRLRSVEERLGQRFVHPLEIDQLQALVKPAVDDAQAQQPSEAFARLEANLDELTAEPVGVGFLVPGWLEALEDEADRCHNRSLQDEEPPVPEPPVPQARISLSEARRLMRRWDDEMHDMYL